MLGPVMIHHRKTYVTYYTLASRVAAASPKLKDVKGIVTDGEEPLQNSFSHVFSNTQPLRDFRHFRQNMDNALNDLGISAKKDRTPFLNDVFGYVENEVYVKGLCDSDNEVEFRVMLDSFRPLWKDRETLLIEGTSKEQVYSLAVADKEHCLMEFFEKFGKNSVKTTNISTLANTGINRTASGKKGQHNKTRHCTRQGENPLHEEFPQVLDLSKRKLYTEVWQNDNPFDVVLISGNISKCASCGLSFPKSNRPIPYDIVLQHSERYEYPDKESPGHTKKSYKERNGYYHVDPECIKQRHPHFHNGLLRVDPEVKEKFISTI